MGDFRFSFKATFKMGDFKDECSIYESRIEQREREQLELEDAILARADEIKRQRGIE